MRQAPNWSNQNTELHFNITWSGEAIEVSMRGALDTEARRLGWEGGDSPEQKIVTWGRVQLGGGARA